MEAPRGPYRVVPAPAGFSIVDPDARLLAHVFDERAEARATAYLLAAAPAMQYALTSARMSVRVALTRLQELDAEITAILDAVEGV